MHTCPAGAVGFDGVPVQPALVSVVVGAVWPPASCQPATLTKTSLSETPTGAGIGNVASTPKSLAEASKAWKSPPIAPRIVCPLGTELSAEAPAEPAGPVAPCGPAGP